LEEYILSDDDHRKRVVSKTMLDRATEILPGGHHPNIRETSTTSETLNQNKATGQAPGEDSTPEEGEEAEDPQHSRTTTRKILTSIASIMGEATAPKGAQKQRRTWQESNKRRC
jgi:hypothetical protein